MNQAIRKIEIYDTTLRDGSQGEGLSFSVQDKILIAKKIDEIGFKYIEGGWPGANPKDIAFFKEARKIRFKNAELVAFGSTRKPGSKASQDDVVRGLLDAETRVITVFGKSWDMHVRDVFGTDLDENLRMIEDTVTYLKSRERRVIYDAEHFFDGYAQNPKYAIKTLEAAVSAGASVLVLCDTNGGTLPSALARVVSEVYERLRFPIGIHAHNDGGVAIANSLSAVEAGAGHVQGTINGYGERCGNADLIPIIANLQIKLGFHCLAPSKLAELTELGHYVGEVSNMLPRRDQPYVGQSAFAHKGGVHINAVMKNALTYEHIDPALVGNHRRFLVSEMGGRTNITLKARELAMDLKKESAETRRILEKIQERENQGYQYEAAEASFELLVHEVTGKRKNFFQFKKVHVSAENIGEKDPISRASVQLTVGKKDGSGNATGDGPVNALDKALRKALVPFYPELEKIQLTDYKVRVVDSEAGTAARVRVFIEFRDEKKIWTTVGVSCNIIDASWEALTDAMEYKLLRGR